MIHYSWQFIISRLDYSREVLPMYSQGSRERASWILLYCAQHKLCIFMSEIVFSPVGNLHSKLAQLALADSNLGTNVSSWFHAPFAM